MKQLAGGHTARKWQGRFEPRGLAQNLPTTPAVALLLRVLWRLFQVEPMEHTKKLLYQYEAMMKLKNEEKLSRHQAWESELEVGCSAGEGPDGR